MIMNKMLQTLTEKKQKLDKYRPHPPELVRNLEDWFRDVAAVHHFRFGVSLGDRRSLVHPCDSQCGDYSAGSRPVEKS
jgi:hypothetical protein